jgi:hypothetical protein
MKFLAAGQIDGKYLDMYKGAATPQLWYRKRHLLAGIRSTLKLLNFPPSLLAADLSELSSDLLRRTCWSFLNRRNSFA